MLSRSFFHCTSQPRSFLLLFFLSFLYHLQQSLSRQLRSFSSMRFDLYTHSTPIYCHSAFAVRFSMLNFKQTTSFFFAFWCFQSLFYLSGINKIIFCIYLFYFIKNN